MDPLQNDPRSPLGPEDSVALAIGKVVIAFQLVERYVAIVLSETLSVKDINDRSIVMAALSFGQKVDLLAALWHQRINGDRWTAKSKLCDALKIAEQYRNHVVHSDYYLHRKHTSWLSKKLSIRGGRGLRVKKGVVDATALIEASRAIHSLVMELGSNEQHFNATMISRLDDCVARLKPSSKEPPKPTARTVMPSADAPVAPMPTAAHP